MRQGCTKSSWVTIPTDTRTDTIARATKLIVFQPSITMPRKRDKSTTGGQRPTHQISNMECPEETYISSSLFNDEQEAFENSPLAVSVQKMQLETIDDWVRQIESDSEAKWTMKGLCNDRKKQLAILVWQSLEKLGRHKAHSQYGKKLLRLSRESARRYRKLQSKVDEVRRAIDDLLKFARSIDEELSAPIIRAGQNCLENLHSIGGPPPDDDHWKKQRADFLKYEYLHPVPSNPLQIQMFRLYCFFHENCSLSGKESEVRVALIRNTCWTHYGVRPLKLKAANKGEESKGCTAVRQAVARITSQQRKTR